MAAAEGTTVAIKWLGHAAFKITTSNGFVILIDPWLGNPKAPADAANLEKVDAIFISHGHFDHVGDAVELAKKYDCKGVIDVSVILGLVDTSCLHGVSIAFWSCLCLRSFRLCP